jgi:hypothetical protein
MARSSEHEVTGATEATRGEGEVDRVGESKIVIEKNERDQGAEVTREKLNPQLEGNLKKLC